MIALGSRSRAVPHEALEARGVEQLRGQVERVRPGTGPDRDGIGERLAQLRDVHLDELAAGRRRRVPPKDVDELVHGAFVGVGDHERGEESPLHRGERDRPVVADERDRAEHTHFRRGHATSVNEHPTVEKSALYRFYTGASEALDMSYVIVEDVAASWEQYRPFAEALDGATPDGLLLHAAGPTDEGFRIVGVWESEEAWERFRADRLAPDAEAVAHVPPTFRAMRPAHLVVPDRAHAR